MLVSMYLANQHLAGKSPAEKFDGGHHDDEGHGGHDSKGHGGHENKGHGGHDSKGHGGGGHDKGGKSAGGAFASMAILLLVIAFVIELALGIWAASLSFKANRLVNWGTTASILFAIFAFFANIQYLLIHLVNKLDLISAIKSRGAAAPPQQQLGGGRRRR